MTIRFAQRIKLAVELTWYPGPILICCLMSLPPDETSIRSTPRLIDSSRSTADCSRPHEMYSPVFASFSPEACQSVAEMRMNSGLRAGSAAREISMISRGRRMRFSLDEQVKVSLGYVKQVLSRTGFHHTCQSGGWTAARGSCGAAQAEEHQSQR